MRPGRPPGPELIRLSIFGGRIMMLARLRSIVAVAACTMPTNIPTWARISRPEKASATTAAV
jgi:hypothetical protein